MPVKLNDQDKELRLKKADVKAMVDQYRNFETKEKIKFAHFHLQEILDLLVDNHILDKEKLQAALPQNLKDYGLKLYLGNHCDDRYCPGKPEYRGHNTIIICNTKADSAGYFRDMLDDSKNDSIVLAGYQDGLDLAQICPPECPDDEPEKSDIGLNE